MTIQKFGRGLLIYTVAFASAFTTRYVVRSIRNSTTWSTSEIQSKTQFESNIIIIIFQKILQYNFNFFDKKAHFWWVFFMKFLESV